MERAWMPTVAGILNIITGAFGLTGGLALIALGTLASGALEPFVFGMLPLIPLALFSALGLPLLLLGILTLVGGIYALQRKMWGLVLAGSIAAVLFSRVLGIPAIIFVALSKKEFA